MQDNLSAGFVCERKDIEAFLQVFLGWGHRAEVFSLMAGSAGTSFEKLSVLIQQANGGQSH